MDWYQPGFPTRYFEAEIVSCCNDDYWYKDKIGQRIKVRKHDPSAWGFEEKSTGCQVATTDIRAVGAVPTVAKTLIQNLA